MKAIKFRVHGEGTRDTTNSLALTFHMHTFYPIEEKNVTLEITLLLPFIFVHGTALKDTWPEW